MSNQSSICLKPINALLIDEKGNPTRFWIPAYQRGYRWKPLQVTQLLEDIWDFIKPEDPNRAPKPNEFYCLQPLVLMPREEGLQEVVDGQQRLTTIFLILRYFNRRFSKEFQKTIYEIDFETRKGFLDFLEEPTEETANTNVDFYHLFQAIETIREWFSSRANFINDFESALLNRTKVIWFELGPDENPVDAFTRLNVGKIPLTDDELIRALFLRREAGEKLGEGKQLRIAHEWDQLEKALQSDEFWYFLNNQVGPRQNRIGFLFDLAVRDDDASAGVGQDTYSVFYAYHQKMKVQSANPKEEWRKVKETYMMLEEWFEDSSLYHIVGFLIHQGVRILTLCKESESCTKSEFDRALRQMVYKQIVGSGDLSEMEKSELEESVRAKVEGMEYRPGGNNNPIRSVLLLFNIATLLDDERSNVRFRFDSFKNQEWNIEHVRSVAGDQPERHKDRVHWLEHCLGYLESSDQEKEDKEKQHTEICEKIQKFIVLSQAEAEEEDFEVLYEAVLQKFNEATDDVPDHGIGNLTLLDEKTNKSYKNAVYAVKRQRLLDLDQAGIFVPLCTRNIFLKCYSPQVDNVMFWSEKDRDSYQDVIVEVLTRFFLGRKGGEE